MVLISSCKAPVNVSVSVGATSFLLPILPDGVISDSTNESPTGFES
jgi:hypothetical protein